MRKIVETVREYDASGNLTREVITETTEEGEAERLYSSPSAPAAWWGIDHSTVSQMVNGEWVPAPIVRTDERVVRQCPGCAVSVIEKPTPT